MIMKTLFTADHEWLRIEGDVATIGVTDYAQSQLGDVVFVELPKVGRSLKKAEAAAVVESVKAASDVYAPISGEVVEVNSAVSADPALVNSDAGDRGRSKSGRTDRGDSASIDSSEGGARSGSAVQRDGGARAYARACLT